MHITILRKILARVKQYTPGSSMHTVTLLDALTTPNEYGYGTGDVLFDFLVDTLEEMETEAKHLDLITPPGHE
jgi:hypothetical protein